MGKEKFEEFINQSETQEEKIDWEKRKQWFIEKVNEFYKVIDSYLEPYKDKIKINAIETVIYEDELGSYKVKKRILNVKGHKVEFTPIGTIIIGAWGRIDMEGSNGKVKFVLVPEYSEAPKIESKILLNDKDIKKWEEKQKKEAEKIKKAKKVWKIATPPPNIRYFDLDEDIFFDKLMEVING